MKLSLKQHLDQMESVIAGIRTGSINESSSERWRLIARKIKSSGLTIDANLRMVAVLLRKQRSFLRSRSALGKTLLVRIFLISSVVILARWVLFDVGAVIGEDLWWMDRMLVLGSTALGVTLTVSFLASRPVPWWWSSKSAANGFENWCEALLCDRPAETLAQELRQHLMGLRRAELIDGYCRAIDRANALDEWAHVKSDEDQTRLAQWQMAMPWVEIATGAVVAAGMCAVPLLSKLDGIAPFVG